MKAIKEKVKSINSVDAWKLHADFEKDRKTRHVFTDDGAMANVYVNAATGSGVFFGINDPRNISRRVPSYYA